jgi:hypothetical protein
MVPMGVSRVREAGRTSVSDISEVLPTIPRNVLPIR